MEVKPHSYSTETQHLWNILSVNTAVRLWIMGAYTEAGRIHQKLCNQLQKNPRDSKTATENGLKKGKKRGKKLINIYAFYDPYIAQKETDNREWYTTSTLPIVSTGHSLFHELRSEILLRIEVTEGSLWPTASQPKDDDDGYLCCDSLNSHQCRICRWDNSTLYCRHYTWNIQTIFVWWCHCTKTKHMLEAYWFLSYGALFITGQEPTRDIWFYGNYRSISSKTCWHAFNDYAKNKVNTFIYTGKLCHRGKCHSGNCHSGERWMSRPFVHSGN